MSAGRKWVISTEEYINGEHESTLITSKKYSWCIPVQKEIKLIIWGAAITPEPWNHQQCWFIFEDPNVRVARLATIRMLPYIISARQHYQLCRQSKAGHPSEYYLIPRGPREVYNCMRNRCGYYRVKNLVNLIKAPLSQQPVGAYAGMNLSLKWCNCTDRLHWLVNTTCIVENVHYKNCLLCNLKPYIC